MQIYLQVKFATCLFALLEREKVACGLGPIGHGLKKSWDIPFCLIMTITIFSPIPWPAAKTIDGLLQIDMTELTQYTGKIFMGQILIISATHFNHTGILSFFKIYFPC